MVFAGLVDISYQIMRHYSLWNTQYLVTMGICLHWDVAILHENVPQLHETLKQVDSNITNISNN